MHVRFSSTSVSPQRPTESTKSEPWVLTRVIDVSDPLWDERATIVGSPEQVCAMFNLSKGVPFGWRN